MHNVLLSSIFCPRNSHLRVDVTDKSSKLWQSAFCIIICLNIIHKVRSLNFFTRWRSSYYYVGLVGSSSILTGNNMSFLDVNRNANLQHTYDYNSFIRLQNCKIRNMIQQLYWKCALFTLTATRSCISICILKKSFDKMFSSLYTSTTINYILTYFYTLYDYVLCRLQLGKFAYRIATVNRVTSSLLKLVVISCGICLVPNQIYTDLLPRNWTYFSECLDVIRGAIDLSYYVFHIGDAYWFFWPSVVLFTRETASSYWTFIEFSSHWIIYYKRKAITFNALSGTFYYFYISTNDLNVDNGTAIFCFYLQLYTTARSWSFLQFQLFFS